MFKIDFNDMAKMVLSAAGALLLTVGALAAAAGPAEFGTSDTATYAAAGDAARA